MKSWLCFEQDRNNGRQFSSKKGPFPTAGSSTLRYVEASGVRHKKCAEHHHRAAAQRLERPCKECDVRTYNLWKPGDGNERLELVVRDYWKCSELEVQKNYARSTMAGAVRPRVSP